MPCILTSDVDGVYHLSSVAGVADALCGEALPDRIRALEADHPRWVFTSVERDYPALLESGLRLRRCHDLALAEGLLLAQEGKAGHGRGLAAAYARAKGLPVPDSEPAEHAHQLEAQPALFEPRGNGLPDGVDPVTAAAEVLHDQRRRIESGTHPDRMRLLIAAESASALAAVEMSADGLPWRADLHDELLTELIGPQPSHGARPHKLAELTYQVQAALGAKQLTIDHPGSLLRAFARAGVDLPSTRAHVLREVDHPAVAPLLRYKELARLYSAHGWPWLEQWVHQDRFRPVYVVGGVVSGRWASRGGAALQIPRVLRACVRADPGWRLVVADAAQLEPRILAALAGDERLAAISADTDLYGSLTREISGEDTEDDRARAKVAMLSAMYGGTAGAATALLGVLRKRFPAAVDFVEHAARAGERGERVRSRLGRTSPDPSASWRALTGGAAGEGDGLGDSARRAARDWGRFTRNFVVQASAADWTASLLAALRLRLPAPAHLVFFQHDEVIVHAPADLAQRVEQCVLDSAGEATALVFGQACPVRFPLHIATVDCYADAK